MKYLSETGKINSLAVVLILVGIALLALFIVPSITTNAETGRLNAEIDRVASKSSLKPSSVTCSGVETATICYAEYTATANSVKQMLTASGYTILSSAKGSVSATNQSTSTRVDSEAGSGSNNITLKFKDIQVTL